jgi:hypothetical protein
MSNEEYQHQSYWASSHNVNWLQQQEKSTIITIQKNIDNWFVSTSPCPTKYKLITKNDKVI